ncbi:MAG: hypothetical protein H7336_07365 [Bacteriovorax sp.]|nr:hypothetical protein [Bacteriovorax sp.]
MKNLLIGFCMTFSLSAFATPAGDLHLNPSSLKLKVYKFAVSTSPLCTNLITVIDNESSPQEVEFVGSVNLGSGVLADGTYPCVAIEMSDNIKYTSTASSISGACVANVPNTLDVCRYQGGAAVTSKLINGTTSTCSAGIVDNRVTMYMSTGSPGTGDAFNPPTSIGVGGGFQLATALTVSGTSVAKFVVNPTGKMCDATNSTSGDCDGVNMTATCQLEPPVFNFVKVP